MKLAAVLPPLLLSLVIPLFSMAGPNSLYYGPTTQEGVLAFSAFVEMKSAALPTEEEALAQIKKQYYYMLGNMRWGVESLPATPSRNYEITSLDILPAVEPGLYRIHFFSKLNIAVDKKQATGPYKFVLPRDPSEMEKLTGKECSHDKTHVLWYGFNPRLAGCSLIEGKDYDLVTGYVEVKNNTVETYPEYDKLVGANGEIHMWVLVNNEIFRAEGLIAKLTAEGFTRHTWTETEIADYLGFTPSPLPQVDDFTIQNGAHAMKISIFYGNANINSAGSKGFHHFYKKALEESNIVVYSGHSEYGKNIDLAGIEKRENFTITLKPEYQLYFLNGCITYGYYTDQYLTRKASMNDPRGTLNLDVLGTGAPTPGFDDKPLFALTDAVTAFAKTGIRTSYQAMTNKITYAWLAVVGDEDNPLPVAAAD